MQLDELGELGNSDGARPVRRKRIPLETISELCRLKRDVYPNFSVRRFFELATKEHGLRLSYSWARVVLQHAGIVEKASARGKYPRLRKRRWRGDRKTVLPEKTMEVIK